MKIKHLVFLLCLVFLFGCNEEVEEMTLSLSTYVVENNEIVFKELEPNVKYTIAAENLLVSRFETDGKVAADPEITVYGNPLTVYSNGTVRVSAPAGGIMFSYGHEEVVDHIFFSPAAQSAETYTMRGKGEFTYQIMPTNEELTDAGIISIGVSRIFTVEVYEGNKYDVEGQPRMVVTLRVVYEGNGEKKLTDTKSFGYTLEILSVEYPQPIYW